MMGRKAPLLLRLLKPESLRYQLLSRSLFVLAGLLLLIGTLQYVFMKDFIYNNRAEALKRKYRRCLPCGIWTTYALTKKITL